MKKSFANVMKITDGYKIYHLQQYPKEVLSMYGNLTARADKHFTRIPNKDIFPNLHGTYVAFGMQQAVVELVDLFDETFFSLPFNKVFADISETLEHYVGYESIIGERLKQLHELGYLPLKIKTVYEGDILRMNEPCMVVETEDGFGWLFGYLEPLITSLTWKTIVNATTAMEFYKMAKYYGDITGAPDSAIDFGFHDFSSRGMSGPEDAMRSGVPHLLFFSGTESVGAIDYIERIYNHDYKRDNAIAGSIKATEHSVTTTNIFYERMKIVKSPDYKEMSEADLLFESELRWTKRLLTEVYPDGLCANVGDSFDFERFVTEILPRLRHIILERNGKFVVRPDSFEDPVIGVVGSSKLRFFLELEDMKKYYEEKAKNHWSRTWAVEDGKYHTALPISVKARVLGNVYEYNFGTGTTVFVEKLSFEEAGTLPTLLNLFGFSINEKGFAVLNPQIGLIYGDGFNISRVNELFERFVKMGICTSNIVIGLGGGVYQWNSRDTLGIAYKATSFKVEDGTDIDVYKDPKGSNKKSAKGRFKGVYDHEKHDWIFIDSVDRSESDKCGMKTLFDSGRFINGITKFDKIRHNVKSKMKFFGGGSC